MQTSLGPACALLQGNLKLLHYSEENHVNFDCDKNRRPEIVIGSKVFTWIHALIKFNR